MFFNSQTKNFEYQIKRAYYKYKNRQISKFQYLGSLDQISMQITISSPPNMRYLRSLIVKFKRMC